MRRGGCRALWLLRMQPLAGLVVLPAHPAASTGAVSCTWCRATLGQSAWPDGSTMPNRLLPITINWLAVAG